MAKKDSIARYNLIINKLRKKPCTFEELNDYLILESELQDAEFNISKRTFRRDLDDILSIYKIDIQYDFSKKVYFISDDDLQEMNTRMLEAFDTFNALSISERISKFIHFDKKAINGAEHLFALVKAIEKCKRITFDYHNFWEKKQTKNRNVAPYAIKEFKNRWYLLANDAKDDKLKTFALERIENLVILKQKFVYPKDFDVHRYYEYCFGIMRPEIDSPKKVVLSFDPGESDYLKSLPLHHSQKIIQDDDDAFTIELYINITYDFIKELLAYGERVEVLQPKSLSKTIFQNAKTIQSYYE